jgi:hypothetical protein
MMVCPCVVNTYTSSTGAAHILQSQNCMFLAIRVMGARRIGASCHGTNNARSMHIYECTFSCILVQLEKFPLCSIVLVIDVAMPELRMSDPIFTLW